MIVECPQCSTPREVTRDRGTVCRTCAIQNRRDALNARDVPHKIHTDENGKKVSMYLRVCKCGDENWVGYIPKENQECRKCSASKLGYAMSQNNRKPDDEKKRYEHKCTGCGTVRYLSSNPDKRKTTLCVDCSRKQIRVTDKKRYFTTCPDCPPETATRQISQSSFSQYGANVRCRSCAGKAKPKVYRKSPMQIAKQSRSLSKNSSIPKEALDKVRDINRKHREAQKPNVKLITQTKSEDDMIKEFLKRNKPSVVIDKNEPMPHFVVGGLGSGTSVLGG